MSDINLKLKSYDELIFEITTLNTNKYLLEQKLNKQKEILDKIKEIPLKHIDEANEELQIILRNNNDLEYKNQCSHDFDIIRKNVEIIYKDILELLEEIKKGE